jgi:hypothetical protein
MPAVHSTKLIDQRAVGKAIGVSAWTVIELYKKGIIPGYRITKKALRFDLAECIAALKARAQTEGE